MFQPMSHGSGNTENEICNIKVRNYTEIMQKIYLKMYINSAKNVYRVKSTMAFFTK